VFSSIAIINLHFSPAIWVLRLILTCLKYRTANYIEQTQYVGLYGELVHICNNGGWAWYKLWLDYRNVHMVKFNPYLAISSWKGSVCIRLCFFKSFSKSIAYFIKSALKLKWIYLSLLKKSNAVSIKAILMSNIRLQKDCKKTHNLGSSSRIEQRNLGSTPDAVVRRCALGKDT